jgi:hypothetical protein
MKPTQKVKWPNVTFSSLARFEKALDTWFKRKNIRIWIDEYGHETKPDGEPKGVSRATQAAYAAQAMAIARKDPRVEMFVWFIFRDDKTSLWQSGMQTRTGAAKPALARFRAAAALVSALKPIVKVRGGIANPLVTLPLRELAANAGPGTVVGIDFKVYHRGRLVAVGQPATVLGTDAAVRFRLGGFKPLKKQTYVVRVEANTRDQAAVGRQLTVVAA